MSPRPRDKRRQHRKTQQQRIGERWRQNAERARTRSRPPGEPTAVTRLHEQLFKANIDYTGKAEFRVDERGRIVAAALAGSGIADITPLKGQPLAALDAASLPVADLVPLAGMALKELYLEKSKVEDLGPLEGMPLEKLYLSETSVADLSPLKGMQLAELNLLGTAVSDLSPLAEARIEQLWLNRCPVRDITPLANHPLVSLTLEATDVADISPLAQIPTLQRLHIAETPVTDLSPVASLSLTRLIFTPGRIERGLDGVRDMSTLTEIGPSLERRLSPGEFWTEYDAGKFA